MAARNYIELTLPISIKPTSTDEGYIITDAQGVEQYFYKKKDTDKLEYDGNCIPVSVNQTFDFSVALRRIKDGYKVARKGWNGKGMYLLGINGYATWDKETLANFPECVRKEEKMSRPNKVVDILPSIAMKTADNKVLIGWLASQSDMFAEDWTVVDL